MSDKEMNIAILEGLKQIANEIFSNEINIVPGTYTAAELAKEKSAKGDVIEINYIQTNNESILMRSVCVGSFKCEFERKNIFNLIWKFEQLSGTKQKDKARFVRIEAGFAVVPDIAQPPLSREDVPGVPSACVPLLDAVSFALWFAVRSWVVSARGTVPAPAANIGCSRRESVRIRGATSRTTAPAERLKNKLITV